MSRVVISGERGAKQRRNTWKEGSQQRARKKKASGEGGGRAAPRPRAVGWLVGSLLIIFHFPPDACKSNGPSREAGRPR